MNISSKIFEAYLLCPTKCWLMLRGEVGENNVSAEWMREKNQAYRGNGIKYLSGGPQADEYITTPPDNLNAKTASWRLASDFTARGKELESCIHAIERTPSEGRGKPAQFVPIRFAANNKLTRLDKLLIAFDAHILSETLNREITHGKLIHGDGFSTSKVKTPMLVSEVKKIVGKISSLLTGDMPPDLILNRHCPECDYLHRCRENAIEKDDLSLLGGMTEKEHKKLKSKGIFTVTQLSYTFRPRRRPKRLRDKREKYHHSLKALAIREKKIHIVGGPELKIEGTPVYLDVEGLPDRDFYYLIGVRIRQGDSVVHHSLWADRPEDEEKVWREFVDLLLSLENPVLIHYGSYETTFIKTMCSRYGGPYNPIQTSEVFKTSEVCDHNINHKTTEVFKTSVVSPEKTFPSAINLLSVIYGHAYFPVASNGLKDIAGYCGFQWSETLASGLLSIVWRERWEASREITGKDKLIRYNAEDCEALEVVAQRVNCFGDTQTGNKSEDTDVVDTSRLKREYPQRFKKNTFIIPELDSINKAAYWDYQRERVYLKSKNKKRLKRGRDTSAAEKLSPNKIIDAQPPESCPVCCSKEIYPHGNSSKKIIDLKFTRQGIKRWVVQYRFKRYICQICGVTFYSKNRCWGKGIYGLGIMAYSLYQCIDLMTPAKSIDKNHNKMFGLNLTNGTTSPNFCCKFV